MSGRGEAPGRGWKSGMRGHPAASYGGPSQGPGTGMRAALGSTQGASSSGRGADEAFASAGHGDNGDGSDDDDDAGYPGHEDASSAAAAPGHGSPAPGTAAADSAASGPHSTRPVRRRMRMITSCLECRRRKLKCDKREPCANCVKFGRDCMYLGPKLDSAGQLRLTEIKDKVGSLERQLERDVAHGKASASRQQRILAKDIEDEYPEGRELEPTDLVGLDITYEEDGDTDDLIDLGVQVGRMRMTERIGGMTRPRISEEISASLVGQKRPPPMTNPNQAPPTPPQNEDFPMGASSESWPDFLRPGATYIPPSSSFFMGQPDTAPSLEHLLPTRPAADRLIQQYFEAVHPIARCVHRPSFEAEYQDFWSHVYQNVEPRPSLQALVFSAMFSAAVSMDEATAAQFGRTQKDLYEQLKLGTETALSKANFLRTTRVETLQAFVMYMIPLCRAELSRAHSVLVGAAVRMAECMGLHRDGETYGLNPLDTHVRRLIWHQLCFLDIRTCEAQGPKPAIRRDDYDTKLPLNCEEDQLSRTGATPESADRWTSTLVLLIRFEINEMMRVIWVDRRRLEAKQITLTAVLTKIENFRRLMFEKYDRFLHDDVTIHRYAKLVMNLLLYRLHAMTLHSFHLNAGAQLPPRLRSVLVTAGIMIIEIGIQLETNPLFRPWAWYSGAYLQYQIALLLAAEVYHHPEAREADRVWGCLDYVFNTDRRLPTETKGLQILDEIMNKTALYQRLRKSRPPVQMARAVPSRNPTGGKGVEGDTMPPHLHQAQAQQQGAPVGAGPIPPQPGAPPMGPSGPPAGPPPGAEYAGVSDGQTLWSVVPTDVAASTYSDSSNSNGALPNTVPGQAPMQGIEVDWDILNTLFTNDPVTGNLNISGYSDPSLGIDWQQWS